MQFHTIILYMSLFRNKADTNKHWGHGPPIKREAIMYKKYNGCSVHVKQMSRQRQTSRPHLHPKILCAGGRWPSGVRPRDRSHLTYHGVEQFSFQIGFMLFLYTTRSAAAGFGRHGMPPPACNDTGTTLGQDGSDWSRDLATLTFDLGGHGACGWCGSLFSIRILSLKFV